MTKKAETPKKKSASRAVKRASTEAAVLAFADFIAADRTTWHVTIREGMTRAMIDGLFDALLYAVESGKERGFESVSEYNEFGSKVALSELAARRKRKAEQERERQEAKAKKQQARGARPVNSKGRPATAATGGRIKHCDIKKSPLAVSGLLIQGSAEEPKVEMFSPHKGLKHALFTVSSSVVAAIIRSWYAIEQDDLNHLFTVGKQIPVQWLVHWVPSPRNPVWKDIVDIGIPKMSMLRRKEQIQSSQGDGDEFPNDAPF